MYIYRKNMIFIVAVAVMLIGCGRKNYEDLELSKFNDSDEDSRIVIDIQPGKIFEDTAILNLVLTNKGNHLVMPGNPVLEVQKDKAWYKVKSKTEIFINEIEETIRAGGQLKNKFQLDQYYIEPGQYRLVIEYHLTNQKYGFCTKEFQIF